MLGWPIVAALAAVLIVGGSAPAFLALWFVLVVGGWLITLPRR
jgi:hypothetical protein